MASNVIMPQMGFDMTEGMIVRWLKRQGDPVTRGEAIAEIETDKATIELEAYESGIMARILTPEGVVVPVGQTIGVITDPGEEVPDELLPSQTSTPAPGTTPTQPAPLMPPVIPVVTTPSTTRAVDTGERVPVTPVARRIASQAGIVSQEIQNNVRGTGPGGRITRGDVEAYVATRTTKSPAMEMTSQAQPSLADRIGIVVPAGLPPIRQAIARRMSLSKLTAPHYYITVDIDMTRAVDIRADINEEIDAENRVTINDLIIKAVATALRSHPNFNVTVQAEGIIPNETTDISIAVAMDGGGLIAPAMSDVGDDGLLRIAERSRDLAGRARDGRLRPNEISGIGFAVSNLGMYGVKDFVAIITPPNAGAIAIGSIVATPVVRDGKIVIAQMMSATLSADHRATDGAEGAQFMNETRRLLERPALLLL